jgi:hypothetical protein
VYNAARGAPVPSVNAAVSLMLFVSLGVAGLAYVVYRVLTRRRPADSGAMGDLGSAAGL